MRHGFLFAMAIVGVLLICQPTAIAQSRRVQEYGTIPDQHKITLSPTEAKDGVPFSQNPNSTNYDGYLFPNLIENGKDVYLALTKFPPFPWKYEWPENRESFAISIQRLDSDNTIQYPLEGDSTYLFSRRRIEGGEEFRWTKTAKGSYLVQATKGKYAEWFVDFEPPDVEQKLKIPGTRGETSEIAVISWRGKLSKEPGKMSHLYFENRKGPKKYEIAK